MPEFGGIEVIRRMIKFFNSSCLLVSMKILHLTLKKKWFDEILQKRKVEEYREIKPYWAKRLFNSDGSIKDYDLIVFRNGYSKNAPEMKVEFKGIKTKTFGDKKYYAIELGNILEKRNC